MRYYALIVFVSLFIPSCISQKGVNLDDGVTSAEIIGKSVIHECKKAIDASIEEYGKPLNKDLILEGLTKKATAFVLKNRKNNKLAGVEEEFFIGSWNYTVRSKDGQPKKYKLMYLRQDSNNLNPSEPKLQFFISDYEIQNDAEYESKATPGIVILPLEIYFDGNSTKPFIVKWFKGSSNNLAQTIGDNVHLLVKEMQKFKTMTIVANPYKEPVTFDLSGFQRAFQKLASQCESFHAKN